MQTTTGRNRPIVIQKEITRMINISPLVVIVLTALFIALAMASDNIHQLLDPTYRQKIQDEQKSIKDLDDILERVEKNNR
jgi:hypothetical protein